MISITINVENYDEGVEIFNKLAGKSETPQPAPTSPASVEISNTFDADPYQPIAPAPTADDTISYDSKGVAYHPDCHSANRTQNKDGTWRLKKGGSAEDVDAIIRAAYGDSAYQTTAPAPAPTADDTPPPAPTADDTPPPAPTADGVQWSWEKICSEIVAPSIMDGTFSDPAFVEEMLSEGGYKRGRDLEAVGQEAMSIFASKLRSRIATAKLS